MRSLARLFSSSRRAPPKAASKLHLSSAWRSPSVFITCVCTEEPEATGEMPRLHAILIDMDQQVHSDALRRRVAKG